MMKVDLHKKLNQDSSFTGCVALKGFFKITADWGLNNQQLGVCG
ncbi:hypothetical protein [Nitrosococcus watsonii]|nr:hypothetical protein [Nitrosococcus watsonii]